MVCKVLLSLVQIVLDRVGQGHIMHDIVYVMYLPLRCTIGTN